MTDLALTPEVGNCDSWDCNRPATHVARWPSEVRKGHWVEGRYCAECADTLGVVAIPVERAA